MTTVGIWRMAVAGWLSLAAVSRGLAWDYEGHRAVNLLALESLPPGFPSFPRAPLAAERLAFLGGEPDRWRNVSESPLRHLNATDHYLNIENLEPLGLDLDSVSDLRQVYTEQIVRAHLEHPERFREPDPEKDKDHTRQSPGYLPWAITENFYKLKSAFSYLKTLEENGAPDEIENARANALYYMGVLGHYVGDATQPLHTTKHFNGWVGSNPQRYTTSRQFHQWIDGGFLSRTGGLDLALLKTRVRPASIVDGPAGASERDAIFESTIEFLKVHFSKVETLYRLDKEQGLSPKSARGVEGRKFLEGQIVAAGERLGSLWFTAWKEAPVDTFLRAQLLKRKLRSGKNPEDANP